MKQLWALSHSYPARTHTGQHSMYAFPTLHETRWHMPSTGASKTGAATVTVKPSG